MVVLWGGAVSYERGTPAVTPAEGPCFGANANTQYPGVLKNNYFTEMCSGSEAGSYLRLIDLCITQL